MSRRRRPGHLALLVGAVSALLALSSCGSDKPGDVSIKTADAYSAALRWYLASLPPPTVTTDAEGKPLPAPGPLIVYVAPVSGKAIDSQAQVSVVKDMADMKDVVTIRFADVRDDALDVETPEHPVKDSGVLLLVGEVAEGPPPVAVTVAVYHNTTDTHSFVMRITKAGDKASATSVSEVAQG